MSLTLGGGPLVAKDQPPSNYEIEGPKHRILWGEFPRRVRAELGGETVLDTTGGRLLHESQMLPVLYVPEADIAMGLLEPTEKHTFCPFKGEASYWSIRTPGATAKDAVWSYPSPNDEAPWLAGHLAFYWDELDAWYDEDEQVFGGHLRDPFHRIDVRPTSRAVTIRARGEVLAESTDAKVLSETGLPNRIYLPLADVRAGALEPSVSHTHCPYKGEASYWTVSADGRRLTDAAFSYPEPFDEAGRIGGLVCFLHDETETIIA
ncbi:MAG: DUF427 domain-containing protein [Solirubrobacterales bacterium]|nr:DUF427 domain-containing protein [Solirubrobacterales bacterium]